MDNLVTYVECLLKMDNGITDKIRQQIFKYHKYNGYSYSGMQKTLKYFYEIKGNPIEKANGSLGILPYVYDEARQYYLKLYEAQQHNSQLSIEEFIPKEKVIRIKPPRRKIKKRNLFSFLDE